MRNNTAIPQLFLRLALGLGFLLPVLDRVGWLGASGVHGNAWGNWPNFVMYTHTLMPYMPAFLTEAMALLATVAEILFGLALIIGYKTRWAATGSFLLTLIFACSMFFFAGMRAPFSYSVFADSAASLLLACVAQYRWSIDQALSSGK